MRAAGHESGKVCHVDEIISSNFVCNVTHPGEINRAGVRTAPADNQLRTFLLRKLFERVVVDGFGFLGDAIGDDLVGFAREIEMMPVREMPAVREVQAKNRVARLQNSRVGLHVGLRSSVRLYVGMLRAKELFRAITREILDHVRKLAATVVALAGISLGI